MQRKNDGGYFAVWLARHDMASSIAVASPPGGCGRGSGKGLLRGFGIRKLIDLRERERALCVGGAAGVLEFGAAPANDAAPHFLDPLGVERDQPPQDFLVAQVRRIALSGGFLVLDEIDRAVDQRVTLFVPRRSHVTRPSSTRATSPSGPTARRKPPGGRADGD